MNGAGSDIIGLDGLGSESSLFDQVVQYDDLLPAVLVVDDFYDDPLAVRDLALTKDFFAYCPQSPSEPAGPKGPLPPWSATSLLRYGGEVVSNPQPGFRYLTASNYNMLEDLVRARIDDSTWETGGDWWNGAFHLLSHEWSMSCSAIHHHHKPGDIERQGWSGVVYLGLSNAADSGTSIWKEVSTGRCTAAYGSFFAMDRSGFELVLHVPPRLNRLVLFRESVLHSAGRGYGSTRKDARLTQTFFFEVTPD